MGLAKGCLDKLSHSLHVMYKKSFWHTVFTQYRHYNREDSKRCGHIGGEKDNIKAILYAFSWDMIEIAFWKSLQPSMKHFSFRGMSIFPAVILVWWLPPFLILFFFIQTCVWTGLLYMDGMHSNNFLNVVTIHPRFPTAVVTMAILRVFLWTHYLTEIIWKTKKTPFHLRYLPAFCTSCEWLLSLQI